MTPLSATAGVPSGASRPDLAGRPVVVGFDGSPPSVAALRWSASEAARLQAPLTVVYAANVPVLAPWHRSPGEPSTSHVAEISARLAQRGADLARREHPDLVVRSRGVLGGAAGELIDASQSAGLLVVGRRPRGALQAAVLGSVSFSVIMHARCPVVVVQETAGRRPGAQWPVVVGVDGSRASHGALAFAAEVAASTGAPLEVVACWSPVGSEAWAEELGKPADALLTDGEERRAREVMGESVSAARRAHPTAEVTGRLAEGRPDDVLVASSEEAGLVVVGSRGHGGFAGMMLGSVSHSVLRGASCPVAVVRRGAI